MKKEQRKKIKKVGIEDSGKERRRKEGWEAEERKERRGEPSTWGSRACYVVPH